MASGSDGSTELKLNVSQLEAASEKLNYQYASSEYARKLPSELLLCIFSFASPPRLSSEFVADTFLPKLALLNKSYLEIARIMLYTDVYLHSHGLFSTREIVSRLQWSLIVHPSLASYIRGIHYGGDSEVTEQEIKLLADIISRAEHLQRLRIFGWEQYSLPRLAEAVRSSHGLQSIELSVFSLAHTYGGSIFRSLIHFFDMLHGWPNIQEVVVHSQTMGWERGVVPAGFTLAHILPGQCAHLKKLVYRSAEYWEDRHVRAMAVMAPNITELSLSGVLTGMSREALGLALIQWAPCLERLHLHFPNTEADHGHATLGVDDALIRMDRLTNFSAGTSFLHIASLARGFARLETLQLRLRDEEFSELFDALRDTRVLPHLKELDVWPEKQLPQHAIGALPEICRARQVSLAINGTID